MQQSPEQRKWKYFSNIEMVKSAAGDGWSEKFKLNLSFPFFSLRSLSTWHYLTISITHQTPENSRKKQYFAANVLEKSFSYLSSFAMSNGLDWDHIYWLIKRLSEMDTLHSTLWYQPQPTTGVSAPVLRYSHSHSDDWIRTTAHKTIIQDSQILKEFFILFCFQSLFMWRTLISGDN